MDQSGSRPQSLKSPLIERPELQSPRQRTLYAGLTLVFWVFWIYLWVPLLALLAWALGVQQAYQYMVVLGGYQEIVRIAELYGIVILLLGGCLLLWAGYNILRFRGVENRAAAPPLSSEDIGRYFDQDPSAVAGWQTLRQLHVTHDQTGRIERVEAGADGATALV